MNIRTDGDYPVIDLSDSELLLTHSQAEALQFDTERIVSAGAGSGKTQTLSLRYTSLLLHQAWQGVLTDRQPSIEEVVVLTFTDKAAKEMLARCYGQLRSVADAVEVSADEITSRWGAKKSQSYVANIRRFLDQFEQARISTFHSFCNRLLREEGLLNGIHHNTQLLEDHQIALWQKRAVREMYMPWREEVEPEVFESIAQCFRGRSALEACVTKLLNERTKFIDATVPWAHRGALLTNLLDEAPVSSEHVREWMRTEAASVLEQVAGLLSPAEPPFYTDTLLPLLDRVHTPPTDPLALHHLYRQVLSPFTKTDRLQDFGRQAIMGRSALWTQRSSQATYKANKAALKLLHATCDHWPSLLVDAQALPTPSDKYADDVMTGVGRFFFMARDHLEQQHRTSSVIDHDGLQIQAVRLLRDNPQLLQKLQGRHRYLMVDEFQDTDAVQWEILERIGRPNGQKSDRLFAVGDLKQAIYRFRGGDVSVFNQVRRDIGVETSFEHNFRSRSAIVDFTNVFFRQVMGEARESRKPWEAHYESVKAGRLDPTPSTLKLLPVGHSNARDTAYDEGVAIARLCRQILDPEGEYAHEGYGDYHTHPEAPIAILIRQRTHLAQYQKALQQSGVPYRVVKGVGFWSRACVIDLVTALHAALTSDPISTIGFLRSPLACVSDAEISAIFSGNCTPVLDPSNFMTATATQRWPDSLARAQRLLQTAAIRSKQTNLRGVAEEVLAVGGTSHAWSLEGNPQADRANTQKLLEKISGFEHLGWSAARILDFLLEQIEHQPKENEADQLSGHARVVVQTIHSAKGLEFPVVILPSLGAKRVQSDHVQIGKTPQGWSFGVKAPDPMASVSKKVDTVRTTQFRERRTAEERSEDLRLLYVAITRAAEHLFFVGDPEKASKNSWMEHLLPFVEAEGTADGPIKLLDSIPSSSVVPEAQANPGLPAEFVAISVDDVHPVNPSSLKEFQKCALCWKRQRTLGTPRGRANPKDHNKRAGALRGNLLHELLERACFDRRLATDIWWAEARSLGFPDAVSQSQLQRLLHDLDRMSKDPALQNILRGETFFEAAYDLQWNTIRMQGRIDLLWRDPQRNDWVLIDFKSEHVSEDDVDQHRDQLTAYAWAASRLLDTPVYRTEIYSTRSAKRLPLPTLGPEDFSRFEGLLEELEGYAKRPFEQLQKQFNGESGTHACKDCLDHSARDSRVRVDP